MYRKILVPLDGSPLAESVLDHVTSIAGGCQAQSVLLLQVVEPFYMPSGVDDAMENIDPKAVNAQNEKSALEYLNRVADRLKIDNVKVDTVVIMSEALGSSNIARSISEYATNSKADLVVIATHGRSGVSRWVWGSVADRILRSACIPVLMVRAPGCLPGI